MTAQGFLDKVSEKENGAAAKPAPKRRAWRVGEPLRWTDRSAGKRRAKPEMCMTLQFFRNLWNEKQSSFIFVETKMKIFSFSKICKFFKNK